MVWRCEPASVGAAGVGPHWRRNSDAIQSTLPVTRLRTKRTSGDGRNARARFATTYFGTGPLHDRSDELPLVVGRILEAGREGLLALPDELARDRVLHEHQIVRHADDGRRVQPSAQAGADGHIAPEAKPDRVAEEVSEALGRVPHRETARTWSRKIPIPPHRDLRLHRPGMRGRELPDPFKEGVLGMVEAGPLEVIEDGALVRRGPP